MGLEVEQKSKKKGYQSLELNIPFQEISFAVTEDCNLNCSYCYLASKNTGKRMSFSTAKQAIDYFLENGDLFTAPQIRIEFIGGEPLLEAELIDQITDYFKIEAYRRNHPWFNNYKLSFSTNGTLYHRDEIQEFVEKNKNSLIPSISLDGIEEKHNNARKYRDGRPSYQDVLRNAKLMLAQLPYSTVKATFGRGDIKYFKDSVIHLLQLGFHLDNILANVAYEDLWEEGDDVLFEQQLIELADYLIDNNICSSNNYGMIFSPQMGKPYTEEHLSKHWCNAGNSILVGVEGDFYPCIRFLEMAFDNNNGLARKIGSIHQGINLDRLRPYRLLTLKNCSPEECLECSVATGCNMCSGQALAESSTGTIFNRAVYICKMHQARVRANNYFWEKLAAKEKRNLPKNDYLQQLMMPRKKVLNLLLSADSPSICNYDIPAGVDANNRIMPLEILEKYIALAKKENYFINYILPNHDIEDAYQSLLDRTKFQVMSAYKNEGNPFPLKHGRIFVLNVGDPVLKEFSCAIVILHLKKEKLQFLKDYILKLFNLGVMRINLIIDCLSCWEEADLHVYREVLTEISQDIFTFFQQNQQKILNVLTDRIFLHKMNNCNAGKEHFTIGPDGRKYLCPAFYYKNQPLDNSSEDLTVSKELLNLLEFTNAPLCQSCDAYHCMRCFFQNKECTDELIVPGRKQCIISHLEREVSGQLQKRLVENNLIPYPNRNMIPPLNYRDPFEVVKVW